MTDELSIGFIERACAKVQIFCEDLNKVLLSDDQRKHLFGSLRLKNHDRIVASDGFGSWVFCIINGDDLEVVSDVYQQEKLFESTVYFSITKSQKPELVVQKLTELGVGKIVPLKTERAVVQWDDRKVAQVMQRFRNVSLSAAEQSRNVFLPTISDPIELKDIPEEERIFADFSGGDCSSSVRSICVGPEGGFTDNERKLASGFVTLGPRVLRAETAAIIAGFLVTR